MAYASTSNDTSLATLTGSQYDTSDGRTFALIQNAGVALVAGNVIQGPVAIGANHTGLVASTVAIGATSLTVTLGGTAVTANQYQGGFVIISAGTGLGQMFRIKSHPAATTVATCLLQLEDTVNVATLTSDSKATLVLPQYGSANGADVRTSGCVVSPVTATGPTIGVSVTPIAASTSTVPSYGFIQTHGVVGVLNDANTAIGLDVMPSSGTAGAVVTYVVATRNRIGTSTVAGETTKVQAINLQL